MKIGLDWSGVIADVHEARRLVLMEMYGKTKYGDLVCGPYRGNSIIRPFSIEYCDLLNHIYFGRVPKSLFTKDWVLSTDKKACSEDSWLTVGNAQYEAMKETLYERPEYALNIPAINGALNAVAALCADGHDVEVVTSRGPYGIPEKVVAEWLAMHMPGIPARYGMKDKTQVLHEYDLFVDDKKRQLAPEDSSIQTLRILFEHHYNEEDAKFFNSEPKGRTRRCRDWNSILDVVREAA